MINVAIVGSGGMGKFHSMIYTLLPDVTVVATADIRLDEALEAAKAHGANAYTSIKEMLAKEEPDVVDICTPTYLHAPMAIECMERGFHVLCEKPMTLNLKDAEAMAETASKTGRIFMIAQVIRFWDEFIYLKKVFDANTYGALRQVWFSRTGSAPFWSWDGWFLDEKRSGLTPFDLHVHDADFIYYVFGKPEAVRSTWIHQPDNPSLNGIRTEYSYPDILVGAEGGWYPVRLPFQAVYRAIFDQAILELRSDGRLVLYPLDDEPRLVDMPQPIKTETTINLAAGRPYYNEIRYFIDCVQKNDHPEIITPQQSVDVIRMIHKEIESAKKGRRIAL